MDKRDIVRRELALLLLRAVSDTVAEILVVHEHHCPAREAALALLERCNLDPDVFVIEWANGRYDG
jgi:hypothetical protein